MWNDILKFLEQKRQHIDVEEVPAGIWSKLEKKLHPTPWYRKRSFLVAAASAMIFALSAAVFWNLSTNSGANAAEVFYAESAELTEAEFYYQSASAQLINQIHEHLPDGESESLAFMDDLEDAYEQLKKDALLTGMTEQVIAAMINNYRLRIYMLERLLNEFQDAKSEEQNKNGDEKSDFQS